MKLLAIDSNMWNYEQIKLSVLDRNTWNPQTLHDKTTLARLKLLPTKYSFTNHKCVMYMYE